MSEREKQEIKPEDVGSLDDAIGGLPYPEPDFKAQLEKMKDALKDAQGDDPLAPPHVDTPAHAHGDTPTHAGGLPEPPDPAVEVMEDGPQKKALRAVFDEAPDGAVVFCPSEMEVMQIAQWCFKEKRELVTKQRSDKEAPLWRLRGRP